MLKFRTENAFSQDTSSCFPPAASLLTRHHKKHLSILQWTKKREMTRVSLVQVHFAHFPNSPFQCPCSTGLHLHLCARNLKIIENQTNQTQGFDKSASCLLFSSCARCRRCWAGHQAEPIQLSVLLMRSIVSWQNHKSQDVWQGKERIAKESREKYSADQERLVRLEFRVKLHLYDMKGSSKTMIIIEQQKSLKFRPTIVINR